MAGSYAIEDLRDYITELYHNQRYTETEVLTALLNYGVQTNADQLRRHLELWQLSSVSAAPSQGADPPQTSGYSSIAYPGRGPNPTSNNDRIQHFLQEDNEHERLALRMTNLSQDDCCNENIDLSEQPSNLQQHSSAGECPKGRSNHDKR